MIEGELKKRITQVLEQYRTFWVIYENGVDKRATEREVIERIIDEANKDFPIKKLKQRLANQRKHSVGNTDPLDEELYTKLLKWFGDLS